MRLLVELTSSSSQHKETHNLSYADIITFMIQCIADIVLYGKRFSTVSKTNFL